MKTISYVTDSGAIIRVPFEDNETPPETYYPPIPAHPNPLIVLGLRDNIIRDYRRGYSTDGDSLAPAKQFRPYVERAVPYWWDFSMIQLALSSPLPPNYVLPRSPHITSLHLFHLPNQEPSTFCHVLDIDVGNKHTGYGMFPKAKMRELFPDLDVNRIPDSLVIFLSSPYIQTIQAANISRQQRRYAERKGLDPMLARFVVLRDMPSPHGKSNEQNGSREWHSRWMVRGHYRNQWYPTLNAHKTIWVASYIKGPADMPLREPIYKVAR